MISLDERYLKNSLSTFIIEVDGHSPSLGLKNKDKLIIDRSLRPKDEDLVLLVKSNAFSIERWSATTLPLQDFDSGDFVWGVVITVLREFKPLSRRG